MPRTARLVLLAAGIALTLPATASPGPRIEPCSDVILRNALRNIAPGPPPLLIGDSVAGFSFETIQRAGYRVNAEGCRTFRRGVEALREEASGPRPLPRFVVLELGTAGKIEMGMIEEAHELVGDRRTLGLVTPRAFRGERKARGVRTIRRAATQLKRVRLIDWARFSRGRNEWFHPDRVHPNSRGAQRLGDLLSRVGKQVLRRR